MSSLSFKQALCNAIAAEREAERLYNTLCDKSKDPNTIAFLKDIANDERKHASDLEEIKSKFPNLEFCPEPDQISNIEAPMGWEDVDEINFVDAINIAIQGENNATMIYDALSDSTEGEVSEFFKSLSKTESLHALKLEKIKEKSLR